MVATFNFAPLRQVGINLIKKFGRPVPCRLVRSIDGAPADPTKPWRPSAATEYVFQFTGVVLPFVTKSSKDVDADTVIYVPGDIITAAADAPNASTLCGPVLPSDNVESQGTAYSIVAMHNLTPGADPIFFHLRCKAWPSDTVTPATQF